MSPTADIYPWLIALAAWLVGGMLLAWLLCCVVSKLPQCEAFLDQNMPTSIIVLFICGPIVWFAVAWTHIAFDRELARIDREN
ncbi:MAG TPA: hypothetical protein ENN42_02910 [Thioalkalivibrio sp.]|mgnify:CR=1 FL=1|nr:hypothetical protein [Thioalkalivibrio sp.]